MARVAVLVPDLLFGSRVVSMLDQAGHAVATCAGEAEAWSAVPQSDLLVVDLASDEVDGITLVDSMHAGGGLRRTRTLGFYPHVDTETRARAERAGFDLVVPRSRMAREGAELVDGLLEAQP